MPKEVNQYKVVLPWWKDYNIWWSKENGRRRFQQKYKIRDIGWQENCIEGGTKENLIGKQKPIFTIYRMGLHCFSDSSSGFRDRHRHTELLHSFVRVAFALTFLVLNFKCVLQHWLQISTTSITIVLDVYVLLKNRYIMIFYNSLVKKKYWIWSF